MEVKDFVLELGDGIFLVSDLFDHFVDGGPGHALGNFICEALLGKGKDNCECGSWGCGQVRGGDLVLHLSVNLDFHLIKNFFSPSHFTRYFFYALQGGYWQQFRGTCRRMVGGFAGSIARDIGHDEVAGVKEMP